MTAILSCMVSVSVCLVLADFRETRRGWIWGQAASTKRDSGALGQTVQLLKRFFGSVTNRPQDTAVWEDICFSLAFHLRAGETVAQGLKSVSQEGDSGPHAVLKRAFAAYEAGSPILESVTSVAEGHPEMRHLAGVLQLGAVSGGDLPTLLCQASDSLRRRRMKRREAKAMVAEARLTAIILTVMPWGIGLYVARHDPRASRVFFGDPTGRALFYAALGLWGAGVAVVWRLIKSATPKSPY